MGELIISPEDLADIQAQCPRRAAELEATRSAAEQSIPLPAPGKVILGAFEQAQGFAAATQQMPAPVRAFSEHEDPVRAGRGESDQARAERERLTALGGWGG